MTAKYFEKTFPIHTNDFEFLSKLIKTEDIVSVRNSVQKGNHTYSALHHLSHRLQNLRRWLQNLGRRLQSLCRQSIMEFHWLMCFLSY